MPFASSGEIELFHDTTGDPSDPPVVLVAGIGQQMIGWDAEAVRDLADQGYFVVRFDNRDVGLSTKLSGDVDLMAALRVYWGPHHWDEARARARAAASYDRSFFPEGRQRQFGALLADGDLTPESTRPTVPTLVVHGGVDPLIDVSGGEATADAIPDAKLAIFPTMGHDVPPALWPEIRDLMTAHFSTRAA